MTNALTLDDFIATLSALPPDLPIMTESGHAIIEPQPVMPSLDFEMGDTSNVIAAGLPVSLSNVQTVADVLDMYGFALEMFAHVGARGDSRLLIADHGVGVMQIVAVAVVPGQKAVLKFAPEPASTSGA